MKQNSVNPNIAPQKKGSKQDTQITGDVSELSDGELNKVSGGTVPHSDLIDHSDLKIEKLVDKVSP
jgi:hypothetical protein